MTWSFISVEEGGRDSSYSLDSAGQPACGKFPTRWVHVDSFAVIPRVWEGGGSSHPLSPILTWAMGLWSGQGQYSFFPSGFLANAWLRPATHVRVPGRMRSAFSEPKGILS